MLVTNHKSYGNKIFKKRHDQYFDCDKQERYKTPFLRLRDHHRYNVAKLTKAQKKQEIEWLELRRQREKEETINYALAYKNDSIRIDSQMLLETLQQMGNESTKLYDDCQK